jgi:hypothetical protein
VHRAGQTTDYAISRTSCWIRYCLSHQTHSTQKDTLFRPGCASPTGRHEKLPAARAGHEIDMKSQFCREDTRHLCTFVRFHACWYRPQFVRLRTIYDRTVGGARVTEAEHGSRIWIHSVTILSFVREFYAFLYAEKKRILIRKELKTGLIILIIRRKSDFNTLKNCI